ncbi:MAG: DUF2336 domain-containing protein [Kiloniellales bacterium]
MTQGLSNAPAPEPALSYEESKRLAQHRDPAVRASLAGRADVRPEILCFLAGDPSPDVRRQIANNLSTPAQANLVLARDSDEMVRSDLASKVARLTSDLSSQDRAKAQRYVEDTLALLARDQASRVRVILAEALKDVADAPPAVIRSLAQDREDSVALPLLELSPLLSDLDLLEIIGAGCVSGRLHAISRRQGLGEEIADAIVATSDRAAITSLLENKSAQIREETLDRLVEEAAGVPEWHRPLVERPQLSGRAAQKLATFVASVLLQELQARSDLDAETARRVAQEVHRRLVEEAAAESGDAKPCAKGSEGNGHDPNMTIEDEALLRALASGDRAMVRSGLALRSGLGDATIDKILNSASPKAVTALAWKAGLSMRVATQLQLRMAGIAPKKALLARGGTNFPLSEDEMNWQLEFFQTLPS